MGQILEERRYSETVLSKRPLKVYFRPAFGTGEATSTTTASSSGGPVRSFLSGVAAIDVAANRRLSQSMRSRILTTVTSSVSLFRLDSIIQKRCQRENVNVF